MSKRIAAARAHLGHRLGHKISQAKLAEMCGWSSGQSRIGNYENGGRQPGPRDLERLSEVTGVSLMWLTFGQGQMVTNSAGYEPHQAGMPGEIRDQAGDYKQDPRAEGKVPLISWVRAGAAESPCLIYEPGDAEQWLYCNRHHSASAYALRVKGDSMTTAVGKSYPDGSVIFVDPELRGNVSAGDAVVAKLAGSDEVTFKVLAQDSGKTFLRPLNKQYPMVTDEFQILGKVIELQFSL